MDSLPNEIIDHIFRMLTRNELLNIRIVSRKWNTFSLKVFNCSNLNIGFRKRDDVIEFCEMMKETCGLKFQKFFLRINVLYCNENENISFFNWTQLYNEISSYVTEYYFFISGGGEEESKIINMILNNAPNLKILYIHTCSDFPKPNFNPLQKVEVLQLESYSLNSRIYCTDRKVDLEIVVNWIEKLPSLKKLHCNFNTMGNNSSEMSKYFQYLQRIPEVSMYVCLFEDHEKQLNELSLIPITTLRLDIVNTNRDEVGRALNLFLKKQSGRLQKLQFGTISKITNLLLPSLPKLEEFIIYSYASSFPRPPPGNFLTFNPKNFMNLRRVMIETLEEVELFIGGVYPTVTKLVVFTYAIRNWRSIFPNLRKFFTCPWDDDDSRLLEQQRLEKLKHVLANLPTDHHLKLGINSLEMLKYLIVNPSSVAKLEIYMNVNPDDSVEKRKLLWNTLTGHARVEHDSFLCIDGVNNIGIPQEMGIQPSILNIKNLYKLRVELDSGENEFYKSISFLSHQKESFKTLKKMIITLMGPLAKSEENKLIFKDFRKHSTCNFNTEIHLTPYYLSTLEFAFSKEKMPVIMMHRTYGNYNKYAVKYVV